MSMGGIFDISEEEKQRRKEAGPKIAEIIIEFDEGKISEDERDERLGEILRWINPERYDRTAWDLSMIPDIDDLDPETAAAIIIGETEEKIRDVENRLYTEEERREVLDDE
jgi:hypothetical protein